ncbi:MAG: hypothetical protein WAV40_04175 [Microgenomates group bacterium]
MKNTHNICLKGDPKLEASQINIPKMSNRSIVIEYPKTENTGKCGMFIQGIFITPSNQSPTTIAIISTTSPSYHFLNFSISIA